jgi:dolichol-phosphate mannosyltransferase
MNAPLVTLSVVTPCYDEQDVLPAFYKRIIAVCRKFDSYELVLIDDGATDGTWPIIRSLVEQNPRVVGVRLSRNHGHQLALTAGLAKATGNRVLVIDADLQDPPELVFAMMDLMEKGLMLSTVGGDVAVANRYLSWLLRTFSIVC